MSSRLSARSLSWFACAAMVAGMGSGTLCQAQDAAPTPATAAPARPAPSPAAKSDPKKSPDASAQPASAATTDPRQAQLVADTAKLLKLSEELKAEVAKTDKDTLSLAVIKKAEEVEQLARSLKERINKTH